MPSFEMSMPVSVVTASHGRGRRIGSAFTLIECLAVIAIIAVLVGMLFPVLAVAKSRSFETVTMSNLRQAGISLEIYSPDGSVSLPYASAKVALESAPTTDPSDYSEYKLNRNWPEPFIGSYGYIRGARPFNDDSEMSDFVNELYEGRPYPVMASIWQGEPKVRVLDPVWEPWTGGGVSPAARECLSKRTCLLPDRLDYLMSDGSAKVHSFRKYGSNAYNPIFSWWYVFSPPVPFPRP